MDVITVNRKAREEVIDVCSLFVQHTTCALTILTNEEGIAADFLSVLHGLVPPATVYVHDS